VWFLFNATLPPLLRGRVCCDSVEYLGLAEGAHSLSEILGTTGARTLGYPLFLWLHKAAVHAVGLDSFDWVQVALFTALMLHVGAALFLFRSMPQAHPVFLGLLIANPGLTSQAALPLTDSLTTSLCTLALGFALRSFSPGCGGPENERSASGSPSRWECLTRSGASGWTTFLNAAAAGAMLGAAVLVRPSLQVIAPAFIVAWGALLSWRARSWNWAPVVAAVALSVVAAPGYWNCSRANGSFCLVPEDWLARAAARSVEVGLGSSRTFTEWNPPRVICAVDESDFEHMQSKCEIDPQHIPLSLLGCYALHPAAAAVHLAKKTIGLLDGFALNTYAAEETTWWQRILGRAFGVLSFVGLCLGAAWWILGRRRRAADLPPQVLLLWCAAYLAVQVNFHVETRYGLPIVPATYALLAWLLPEIQLRWVLAVFALATWLFLSTVIAWDSLPLVWCA
jgi:hypothetical protein